MRGLSLRTFLRMRWPVCNTGTCDVEAGKCLVQCGLPRESPTKNSLYRNIFSGIGAYYFKLLAYKIFPFLFCLPSSLSPFLLPSFFIDRVLLCSLVWNLCPLLPQTPECWEYRHALPCLARLWCCFPVDQTLSSRAETRHTTHREPQLMLVI